MISSPVLISSGDGLKVDVQSQSKPLNVVGWEDIDHSQTLDLGDPGSTSIVFTKDFNDRANAVNYMALRFCDQCDFTPEKRELVLLSQAHNNTSFLPTLCMFENNQKVYVASELSDMSLADIIDCTIPMTETHLSAILNQVSFNYLSSNGN